MIAVVEFLRRAWPYLLALAIVLGALYGAYQHGVSVTQAAWDKQLSDDRATAEKARADAEQAARTEEQRRQQISNQEASHAQPQIDTARADSRDLAGLAVGMRASIDVLATRSCGVPSGAGVAAPSDSATKAAMVLSQLLQRDQARLAELAPLYDEAVARGTACQNINKGLQSTPARR